jgi:hypothetical protein
MTEFLRRQFEHWCVEELLCKYPGLRLRPVAAGEVIIAGTLLFHAEAPDKERIEDEYEIEIAIPESFPKWIPSVRETEGRIPSDFHKLDDGSLCLGSPTRLLLLLSESPSILAFVERCVIPYLYGYSFYKQYGAMPFGELSHHQEGIREDLASIFGIKGVEVVCDFVRLASMKKRHANKQSCPCGSSLRLGKCHRLRVNDLRNRLGRFWFATMYRKLC